MTPMPTLTAIDAFIGSVYLRLSRAPIAPPVLRVVVDAMDAERAALHDPDATHDARDYPEAAHV